MSDHTYHVHVCSSALKSGAVPGPKENYQPGCGAQCERNFRSRWECPTHGDQITVQQVEVVPVQQFRPRRKLADWDLDEGALTGRDPSFGL